MKDTDINLMVAEAIKFGLQYEGDELSSAFWYLIGSLGSAGFSPTTRELIETFRDHVTGVSQFQTQEEE